MSIALYMDEHVPSAITAGLKGRVVDVLTVQEDGRSGFDDPHLLNRAGELGRVMFSKTPICCVWRPRSNVKQNHSPA